MKSVPCMQVELPFSPKVSTFVVRYSSLFAERLNLVSCTSTEYALNKKGVKIYEKGVKCFTIPLIEGDCYVFMSENVSEKNIVHNGSLMPYSVYCSITEKI